MMATVDAYKGNPFTFLWTIENVPKLTPFDLKSPRFVANSIRKETWYLQIVENEVSENEENSFCCWLRLAKEAIETDDEVENLLQEISSIAFEISLLADDGSLLISKTSEESRFYVDLVPSAAFAERRNEFIPNNKLTVQFRMWKRDCEILTRDVCFGRTKLMTYGKSFVWAVKEFSALHSLPAEEVGNIASNDIRLYTLKPLSSRWRPMAFILYLERNYELENVNIVFVTGGDKSYIFGCEISILNAYGKVIVSKAKPGCMDKDLKFSSLISKSELMANKNLLVPNDSLFVSCYLEIPFGDISSRIEYCTQNVSSGVPPNLLSRFHSIMREVDLRFAAENNPLEFKEYFINKMDENDSTNLAAESSESECEDDPFYYDPLDDYDLRNCSTEDQSITDSCKDSCKFKAALKYLHNDTTLSDISLKIGKKIYPAHRNILCSRSAQFEKILNSDKVKTPIDIEDMDESNLCRLLQYIYTDTLEDLDYENALELYKAADHYQLLDLRSKCSYFLGKNLREENLSEILILSKKCRDEELEKKIQEVQEFYGRLEALRQSEPLNLADMMESFSGYDSSSFF